MPATPFDSALNAELFGDRELATLFTDSSCLRAMLVVEGALAKAQAQLGMIPEEAAQKIHRDGMELVIDPALLAKGVGSNGVPVPGMVAEFRRLMAEDGLSQYLHFGATTQDIMDSAQALRLRRALAIIETRLRHLVAALGQLAETEAETPMAARTWGVVATPTSLGAVAAGWGAPLLRHLDGLKAVREDCLVVSLSGAAGTNAAMGPDGSEVRALLAQALGLNDPAGSWHSARGGIAALAGWLTTLTGLLAKMAEDMGNMVRTGEAMLTGAGGSSTMPQKRNPVAPSAIVALANLATGLQASLSGAVAHRDQRDGAAWMTEWLTLPQLVIAAGRAVSLSRQAVDSFAPNRETLLGVLDDGSGLIYAEALQFHMARHMPRPEAQAEVKALCDLVRASGGTLEIAARRHWPDRDFGLLFTPSAQLGDAPIEAMAFATSARAQAPKD